MIYLHYIGPAKKGAAARIGYAATRWGQRGYTGIAARCTHTEVHLGGPWWASSIGSSSIVEGGVRVKHGVMLTPANWLVLELPDTHERNIERALQWFDKHKGQGYDALGAVGSVVPALIPHSLRRFYCTEAVGAATGFADPHMLNPAGMVTMQQAMGAVDITRSFFSK